MRLIQAVIAIVFIVIAIAIFGVTIINAKPTRQAASVPVAASIEVMQMMIDAKNLPIEQSDAL